MTSRLPRLRPLPLAPLIALMLLGLPATARADEVWAESVLDQASALRDASAKVPAGARVLSSDCTDVALPGLTYRYRCSVRYQRATPAAAAPATKP